MITSFRCLPSQPVSKFSVVNAMDLQIESEHDASISTDYLAIYLAMNTKRMSQTSELMTEAKSDHTSSAGLGDLCRNGWSCGSS